MPTTCLKPLAEKLPGLPSGFPSKYLHQPLPVQPLKLLIFAV